MGYGRTAWASPVFASGVDRERTRRCIGFPMASRPQGSQGRPGPSDPTFFHLALRGNQGAAEAVRPYLNLRCRPFPVVRPLPLLDIRTFTGTFEP